MKIIASNIFKGDKIVWAMIFILSFISLLAVYSSTGTLAFKYQEGNMFYYLLRHGGLLFFGFVLILLFQNIPVSFYNKYSIVLIFITIPLLFFTLFKGTNLNEASRWITLPGTGISFQSSDFAKFSLVVFIAHFLAKHQNVDEQVFKRDYTYLMFIILVICALILPANFSTAALLFIISIIILFMGRVKIKYILKLIGLGSGLAVLFISVALLFFPDKGRVATWKNRVETYFSGKEADDDANFQVEQAKIAIASGGFFGKGPGNSTQRNFLPHPYSDFIFAIIIEEYGFIGAFFVVFIYLVLFYRAGIIVRKSKTAFPAFLAVGLLLSLVMQAMINMGVATNVFPVTGQTLPLVSMGGTSIIFTSLSLGIILNISVLNNKESEKETVVDVKKEAEKNQIKSDNEIINEDNKNIDTIKTE
ncbi:MAG TPA: FtsW/RodA/SpoVE family cell cycle protein [Bacteroidales bacterium]|nr:FtsW/RodA/SpoVE family cell cycle protein [Bacteroidales bacterium]